MFVSASLSTCLLTSLSGSLDLQLFSSGVIASNARPVDISLLDTGISQGIGNFQAKVNPFFSPDKFTFFFGENAVQTIDSIVIHKSDIPLLSARDDNTAESLLVGIIGIALQGKSLCEFPKIKLNYWGTGKINRLVISTVIFSFYNLLAFDSNNDIDTSNINDPINPDIY